ncbi:MAG: urea carboxylase-associated family protein [Thermomicrobiales bacterium]
MSDVLGTTTPIKTRHIRPGQGQAVEVKAGQFVQIQTLQGKQVADFVAFSADDHEEYHATSVTQSANANIVPKRGMTLYSNRRQGMFEIVEDTVGRHDMIYACCDPIRYEQLGAPGHANCREALTEALSAYSIGYDRIPTPINWFMNVSIQQRGELEIREPLAEANDYVLLRALKDAIVAVSACPQDLTATNGFAPSDLRLRVFREGSLMPETVEQFVAEVVVVEVAADAEANDAVEKTARRAERRAERRAAMAEAATGEVAEVSDEGNRAAENAEADGAAAGTAAAAVAPDPVAPAVGRPARLQDTAEATVMRVEG